MKKQLLQSFLGFFLLLSVSVFAQPGNSCEDPIVIGTLPFQHLSNTALYSDIIDTFQGSACGAVPGTTNYLTGNEAFYSYASDSDGLISITMKPTAPFSTQSSVFVYDGCANVGVSCIAGAANPNTAIRSFALQVAQGHTYVIVVSSGPTTQTVEYDLLIQKEDCSPKPASVSIDSIIPTSAHLSWDPQSYFSWEVAIQPIGSLVPSGSGVAVTSPEYIASLSPASQYQGWVRAECIPGNNIWTSWSGPYLFNSGICEPSQTCNYTFRLSNATSAGWGSSRVQVRQNGIVVATLGSQLVTGSGPVDVIVPICEGVPFDLFWNVLGTNSQQRRLSIINNHGQTIYTRPTITGTLNSILYSDVIPDCSIPRCDLPPTNVSINTESITNNSATIQWDAPSTNSWDIYIVPAGSDAPNVFTEPTYNNITTPDITQNPLSFTTTIPLLPYHCYDVYVRVNCDPAPSAWSALSDNSTFCTLPSCYKPINAAVVTSSITGTSATFTWEPDIPDQDQTQFEIILIPGPNPPPTSPEFDTPATYPLITTPVGGPYTFTATDLQPATIYYVYIRSRCSPTEVSVCTLLSPFNTITCADADKCNYKFVLTNSGENSWHDGRIQVRQNGIVVATLGATAINNPAGVTVPLCNGVPYDLYWSVSGNQPAQIGISVQNPFQDVVFGMTPGTGTPWTVLYTSTANCVPPVCPKPINTIVTNVTPTSVTLSWDDVAVPTAPAYAIYAVPTGGPAPLNNPATPPTIYPVTNPFTVEGLVPSTSYTFYVKSLCSETESSTWPTLTSTICVTTPLNNQCVNAIPIAVNTGQTCVAANTVHGTTYGANENAMDAPTGANNGCTTTDDDIWYKFVATAASQSINFSNVTGTPGSAKINYSVLSGSCGAFTNLYCSIALSSTATGLTVGETYYIRVYTFQANADQFADFDLCITSAPSNDEIANAANVQVNPLWACNLGLSTQGNTLGATGSLPNITGAGCGYTDDDVWFSFVAANNIHVININDVALSTGTGEVYHTLFSGTPDNLVKLYCSIASESVAAGLTVGETYYIRAYTSTSTVTGLGQYATFNVCISTPPPPATNDECATAIDIPVNMTPICDVSTPGNVIGATQSTGAPSSCLSGKDDDVWFKFTAVAPQQVISLLNVHGTTTNLNHAVYSGTCSGLILKYCSVANELTSTATDFVIGQTYYIRVWSNGTNSQVTVFDICVKSISSCENALSFCGSSPDDPYIYENTAGVPNSTSVACLGSIPNPAYYTIHVSESGPLVFNILQNTEFNPDGEPLGNYLDVDFAAWGPFESASACDSIVFSDCPTCPNNTTNPNFYPSGNIVDCSYDASYTETMTIPNAVAGQYYMVLITNFNGNSGFIRLTQTNLGDPGAGSTSCTDKIRLIAYVDVNANGIKDEGEVNFTEGNFIYQKNDSGPFGNISSQTGVYDLYSDNSSDSFDFTYQILPEYSAYYSCPSPGFSNVTIETDGGSQLLYFPINITQSYSDVSITIVPASVALPGFTYTNKIIYENKGLQTASGTITFQNDPSLSITNISQAGATLNSNGFTYDFTGLQPQETGVIYVDMSVPSIPEVTLGQLLTNTAGVTTTATDIMPDDNNATIVQTVVGSYDPNDKMESHAGEINIDELNSGSYLYYTVRFQNTGTYSAFDIRIEDTLDEMLDESSIRIMSASHTYTLIRTNNHLVWEFNDIFLPTAAEDEAASHGYVNFKVKLKPGYSVGDIISNTAEIYFDFNPAIVTNTVQTEISTPLGTPIFDLSDVILYPNPANTLVYVNLQYTTENLQQVTLYDLLGKAVKQFRANNPRETSIDVSGLAKGVYMVEIKTESNLKLIKKLVIN